MDNWAKGAKRAKRAKREVEDEEDGVFMTRGRFDSRTLTEHHRRFR